MLPLTFAGGSERDFLSLPRDALREAGYQLWKVQCGDEPDDWKPMPTVGAGVRELRVWCADGTHRVIYYVKAMRGVYVLHAFAKKSRSTPKRDIDLARQRLKAVS